MRYASLALAAVVLLPATAAAQRQAPPPAATPKPFNVPQPREFALANGLEVTLIPYGTIPKAQVSLVLRTGNIDEAANEIWLADLTRDLMLEGTTTRSAGDIAREAASYGGAVTMNVGADETAIGGEVLSDFVDEMIGLVADVARNPGFPESELARLKTNRVRQLSIARSQPQALAQEKFAAVIHPNHPYGRSFPTERMIQGYTIDQIRQFYAENYGAVRAHLYVAGVFDAAAVERAARAALGDWAAGTAAAPTAPSPTSARTVHLIDRPGAPQSTIFMGLPVIDPSHADYVPLLVTNALLGGAFGSRITSNIREQKGYTYSPNSVVSVRHRDAVWAEVADVTTNVTGASLKEIFYEIDRLQAEPPPAEELRGIQNYYAGLFVLQNSSRAGLIAQLRFLELHGLPREYLTSFVQRVYAVTPADVQRIAQQYLKDENMTIVVVGDRAQITEQLKPYGEIVN